MDGELGVAERGERAAEPGDDEREHQAGAGVLVRREPGQDEDAGADDAADAERGQGHRAEHPPSRCSPAISASSTSTGLRAKQLSLGRQGLSSSPPEPEWAEPAARSQTAGLRTETMQSHPNEKPG